MTPNSIPDIYLMKRQKSRAGCMTALFVTLAVLALAGIFLLIRWADAPQADVAESESSAPESVAAAEPAAPAPSPAAAPRPKPAPQAPAPSAAPAAPTPASAAPPPLPPAARMSCEGGWASVVEQSDEALVLSVEPSEEARSLTLAW